MACFKSPKKLHKNKLEHRKNISTSFLLLQIHSSRKADFRKLNTHLQLQLAIGFGFTSDWLRKWREIFKSITERGSAKPTQMRITFDTQVKTALSL